jgi:competence protein ComEC
VVAFVVMPAAALAVIVMPFGWETLPLHIMGWGVHVMTGIAYWVAALPGATAVVRAWPAPALAVMILGGLWIALWTRRWRWLGLVPIAAATIAILMDSPADLFVARDAKSAALRGADGKLIIIGVRPDAYTASQWLIRDGDRRNLAAARAGAACDQIGCAASGKQGRVVAIPVSIAALPEDCLRADIIISVLPLHGGCRGPALVLDQFDISRTGAMAIKFAPGGFVIDTVAAERGERPWTHAARKDSSGARAPKQ